MNFLDENGLSRFLNKLKNQFANKHDFDNYVGTNLLRGTRDFVVGKIENPYDTRFYRMDGFYIPDSKQIVDKNTDTGEFPFLFSNKLGSFMSSTVVEDLYPNTEYTISFELSKNGDITTNHINNSFISINMLLEDGYDFAEDSTIQLKDVIDFSLLSTEKWSKEVIHFNTVDGFAVPGSDSNVSDIKKWWMGVEFYLPANCCIRKVKLEKGHIENPIWSPNPLDDISKNGTSTFDSGYISLPLDIEEGGTGAMTRAKASKNLTFLGVNPIESIDDDNAAKWIELGTGYAYFKNKILNGQTYNWCFLINIVLEEEEGIVHQEMWYTNEGPHFFRGGQVDGTNVENGVMYDWHRLVEIKDVYPVGAVYISYVNTSPASLFGGSWTQINGYFLRAANDVGTGGADNITLTAAQSGLRSHTHNIYMKGTAGSGNASVNDPLGVATKQERANYIASVAATNATSSHSNMPAYQDLYVWRRTA